MRTQPLRFQDLFNTLIKSTHKVDLWRYLLLYQRGGIYLDDDAQLPLQERTHQVHLLRTKQQHAQIAIFNNNNNNNNNNSILEYY